ncbi:nuclear transport factor 2 family protein [Sinimarinibacterium sp. CAU 1509]|uniref:limonene-1,2-epoxide hydrolase family protein n=1 Tax=Sinimarinibacterium sp. CAU 1509 TaxID=2562283 RepID=UPI0010AB9568|nr:limonene-1,2-epoxide hydrolase family protein [Sinimarinibacterium sp. CAU 1509]TJY59538.1 nuclear transport factor 2 family protein [Sinimarinibacterium sp. CAU 1509]
MDRTNAEAKSSADLVRAFLGSWNCRDLDHLVSYFSEDAVYHNVPVAPIKGIAGIRKIFAQFLDVFAQASLDVVSIASSTDLVLVERVDRFVMHDGRRIELPVTGVFELAGGKIVRFSDYFDLGDFQRQSGLSL